MIKIAIFNNKKYKFNKLILFSNKLYFFKKMRNKIMNKVKVTIAKIPLEIIVKITTL